MLAAGLLASSASHFPCSHSVLPPVPEARLEQHLTPALPASRYCSRARASPLDQEIAMEARRSLVDRCAAPTRALLDPVATTPTHPFPVVRRPSLPAGVVAIAMDHRLKLRPQRLCFDRSLRHGPPRQPSQDQRIWHSPIHFQDQRIWHSPVHFQSSPSPAFLLLQSSVTPDSPSSPWLQGSALLRFDQHTVLPTAVHLQCPKLQSSIGRGTIQHDS